LSDSSLCRPLECKVLLRVCPGLSASVRPLPSRGMAYSGREVPRLCRECTNGVVAVFNKLLKDGSLPANGSTYPCENIPIGRPCTGYRQGWCHTQSGKQTGPLSIQLPIRFVSFSAAIQYSTSNVRSFHVELPTSAAITILRSFLFTGHLRCQIWASFAFQVETVAMRRWHTLSRAISVFPP
jgi:hypothetical protein